MVLAKILAGVVAAALLYATTTSAIALIALKSVED